MSNSNKSNGFSMYEIISKKRDGYELTSPEITYFIDGYVKGEIPDYQSAALLMAIYLKGFNNRELTDLTRKMMLSGDLISLEGIPGTAPYCGKNIDKHSTGGVGDKVSFVIAPLLAACGVRVPMLSGRSLGHTGGTLDKLEAIPGFNVFLQTGQFKKVLADVGMVISGQTENIVPADRKLYALRDATATVTSIPLIAASIMSKKLALGTDGMVLDIKTGSGAFMNKLEDAIQLGKTMVAIGEKSNRSTIGLVTNMDQPLGYAVGNSLEIMESIETLKGNGPQDLLEVTYGLGAGMLVAAGVETDYNQALLKVEEVMESGKPLEVFRNFIAAQNGNPGVCDNYRLMPKSKHIEELSAPEPGVRADDKPGVRADARARCPGRRTGFISAINSLEVGMTAIDIGAGRKKKEDLIDHSAGFIFHKKVGDEVRKGEPILTLHTNKKESIEAAKQRLLQAISFSREAPEPQPMIRYLIDKNGMRSWDDR